MRVLTISKTLAVAAIVTTFSNINPAQAASLTHQYQLNNSLADTQGGPDLTSNSGTLSQAGGYAFGANKGPSLTGAINASNYSILMDFSIANTNGYRKLIDFKDKSVDRGLYNQNGGLNFYLSAANTNIGLNPNTLARLVLTRDSSTQQVTGYVNGVQQISFTDSGNDAVFSSNVAHFFQDDNATGGGEASAGFLSKLSIYDGALSSQDLGGAGNGGTPVPTPALLPGLVGLGLSAVRKRKAVAQKAVA
jgi:hypothetical protein